MLAIPVSALQLSKRHHSGYVMSWYNDTTEVFIKVKEGCNYTKLVNGVLADTRDNVVFNTSNIQAFGCELFEFRLVRLENDILRELDGAPIRWNDPEEVNNLEFAQLLAQGTIKAYATFSEEIGYQSNGMGAATATRVCLYKLHLSENNRPFENIDGGNKIKTRLKELFRRDPICLKLLSNKSSLRIEDLLDLLSRYNGHLQGVEFEDEIELRDQLKNKLEYFQNTSAVNDLVFSSLILLQTPDGEIFCRRTDLEGARALLKISVEDYGNFKQVENLLSRVMRSYLADSLRKDSSPYLDKVENGIEFLKVNTPTLDVSYYTNELLFYKSVLALKREE
jgi:hypothetical protein